jgi:Subtilase family
VGRIGRGRRAWTALFLAALVALAVPARARADESAAPTAQAVADHGEFLPFASPPPTPVGVCLVDTGVDLNPDTTPAVVYREAYGGGSPDDGDPNHHGTLMAMLAAGAAGNNWGTIGAAPGAIRIVSVRVATSGQSGDLTPYSDGIARCTNAALDYNIKVINLSLSTSASSNSTGLAALENRVDEAHSRGINVVAAAGNNASSAGADYPAAYPPVLAVAASDASGAYCAFSNRGENVDLLAPGCSIDSADPLDGRPEHDVSQGTSDASVIVAAVLGALRAYRTDLTNGQVEQLVKSTTSGGILNVEAAFRAADLPSVIAGGVAHEPAGSESVATDPAMSGNGARPGPTPGASHMRRPAGSVEPWPRPRVRVLRLRRGRISVVVLKRPSGARLEVTVEGHAGEFGGRPILDRFVTDTETVVLNTRKGTALRLRFLAPGRRRSSAVTIVTLVRARHNE